MRVIFDIDSKSADKLLDYCADNQFQPSAVLERLIEQLPTGNHIKTAILNSETESDSTGQDTRQGDR